MPDQTNPITGEVMRADPNFPPVESTVVRPRTYGLWVAMHRMANDANPVLTNNGLTASRFDTIILSHAKRAQAAALKAAGKITCLGYQDIIYDAVLDNAADPEGLQSDCPSGISREEVTDNATVEDWYARNAGALVLNPFGSGGRLLRLDLPQARAAWAANVVARLKNSSVFKWDGVFADDFNYNVEPLTVPAADDQGWWLRAMRPFAQEVYPTMKNNGLLFVPNFGSAAEYRHLFWDAAHMDGYHDEFFMNFGNGSWNGFWYGSLDLAQKAARMGKMAFVSTPGTSNNDTASLRLGLCAALLVTDKTNPDLVSYGFTGVDHTNEKWDSTYFGMDIGKPTEDMHWTGALYTTCLIRYFTDGVVVMNPATNPGAPWSNAAAHVGNQVIALTGGTYSGSGRTNVNSVTLAPGEAAILDKD